MRVIGTLPEQRPPLNAGSAFLYTSAVLALGLAVRWTHLACSLLLVGATTLIVLAGRSDRATAIHWEERLLARARALALAALASGLAQVALQTALLEGRTAAALEPSAIARVLLETQAGHVWLVRYGVLVLLATFLALRLNVERRADWRAARGEAALLGAAALVPIAASGHAAAVEPSAAAAACALRARGGRPRARDPRRRRRHDRHAARAPRAPRVAVRLPPLARDARGRAERGPAGPRREPGRGARPGRDGHRVPRPRVAAPAPRRGDRPPRRGRRACAAAARHRRLPDDLPPPGRAVPGGVDRDGRGSVPDELRRLPRDDGGRRRPGRRPSSPASGRPPRVPHGAAHGGRPLLVDQPRHPARRDARVRRPPERGGAVGPRELPPRAVLCVRGTHPGAERRARALVAHRARLHVRRRPDAGARAQGVSRTTDRAARPLLAARFAPAARPARGALRHSRHAGGRGHRGTERRRARRHQGARRPGARLPPRRPRWR